jgi:hypothetical protein
VKKFAQQMIDDHTKAGEEFNTAVGAQKCQDCLLRLMNSCVASLRASQLYRPPMSAGVDDSPALMALS